MSDALNQVIELLELERLENDCFLGQSQDLGWKAVYGGQLLAQGLRAGQYTVDEELRANSIQAYFVKRAWATAPVTYKVERMHDGRSFSFRRIQAYQENALIFSMQIGFHRPEEGLAYTEVREVVGVPDDFVSEREIALENEERYPAFFRSHAQRERAFEMRPVVDWNPFEEEKLSPYRGFWCRSNGDIPDDSTLHQCLLLWMSDGPILMTALFPHGTSWVDPKMQITSLDHVFWFHRSVLVDDWFFYSMKSPISAYARGFVRGEIIQNGQLISSVMQEGLMRKRN